jgi:hypothetical protein
MLRGSERIRLLSMIGTLCILGLILYHSLKPGKAVPEAEPAAKEQAEAENAPSADRAFIVPGPTDEDAEEWKQAENEFQAITDGTTEIHYTEMHAYVRLFSWIEHQSFGDLKKREPKKVRFDELMQSPDKYRGKLIQLNMLVRQAIEREDNRLGTTYELRGPSDKSGTWLYYVITPSLPEGMKPSDEVNRWVTVEGYFLKLQGYQPGNAKPNARPIRAPLLIGRIQRMASRANAQPPDYGWLYYAAGGFLLLSMIATVVQLIIRRSEKRHRRQLDECRLDRSELPRNPAGELPLPPENAGEEEGFDFKK